MDTFTSNVVPTADVRQRDIYFILDFGDDSKVDPGIVTYGFTNKPVPEEYKSTALPGLYVRLDEGGLFIKSIYIQRRLDQLIKVLPDGSSCVLTPGGIRVF